MKKIAVPVIIILIIAFGYLTGLYMFKIIGMSDNNNNEAQIANEEVEEDECTEIAELYKLGLLEETTNANSQEIKISPNSKITINNYYKECGHTVKTKVKVDEGLINSTKEELQNKYKEYEIKEFSEEQIVLYKELEGICNEHYIVKAKDGYVAIYTLDNKENQTLKEITNISTQYLTLTDVSKLEGGIRAYGKEALNSLIEDFE